MKPSYFLIPILLLFVFFIIQSIGHVGEAALTILVILTAGITWLFHYHYNEWLLMTLGVIGGTLVEIGLRFLGFQQVWNNASLFGVPYWLPLIWGFEFVVITRLGIYLTKRA